MDVAADSREFFKISGRELDDVLYPVTARQFVDRYWTREPLYIKGSPRKFAELFSVPAFHAAARAAGAVHVEFKDGVRLREPQPEDIDVYLKQGATVCLTDIGHANERVQSVMDAIKRQLQFCGVLDLRAYMSSDGCGYDTHTDARITTTLQISGTKRWRFARHAAIEFPLRSIVSGPDGYHLHRFAHDGPPRSWEHFDQPDEAAFSEVILEPGDLLCLPAGTWHSAKAIGHSLAINLAFNTMPCAELFMAAVRERLLAIPAWRGPIPPLLLDRQADGAVPEDVATFFAARLREMQDCIAALAPDGPELAHAWRERIYSRTELAADSAPAVAADPHAIRASDSFVRNVFTDFGWSPDAALKAALTIYEGTRNHCTRLPHAAEAFVRRVMNVRSFRAEDCLSWASEGARHDFCAVQILLRALLDGGVIRREDSPDAATPDTHPTPDSPGMK